MVTLLFIIPAEKNFKKQEIAAENKKKDGDMKEIQGNK